MRYLQIGPSLLGNPNAIRITLVDNGKTEVICEPGLQHLPLVLVETAPTEFTLVPSGVMADIIHGNPWITSIQGDGT